MKAISGKQMCKVLERHGWYLDRINSSHHIYKKTGHAAAVSVPVHGNKTLKDRPATWPTETSWLGGKGSVIL